MTTAIVTLYSGGVSRRNSATALASASGRNVARSGPAISDGADAPDDAAAAIFPSPFQKRAVLAYRPAP